MKLRRRILASEPVTLAACRIAALFVRLVGWTSRWTVVGGEIPRSLHEAERPFVVAFWHARLLLAPLSWDRSRSIHVLMSAHRDGRLAAGIVARFGIHSIAGSTSKGGAQGLRTLLKVLREGGCVGITPDGPRGPRMRAGDGIVSVARLSGAPIVPLALGTGWRKLLPSWDRFLLPFPFSRGSIVWGEPIYVPRDIGEEESRAFRRLVEDRLNAVTAEADRLCSHAPIEPGPEEELPA